MISFSTIRILVLFWGSIVQIEAVRTLQGRLRDSESVVVGAKGVKSVDSVSKGPTYVQQGPSRNTLYVQAVQRRSTPPVSILSRLEYLLGEFDRYRTIYQDSELVAALRRIRALEGSIEANIWSTGKLGACGVLEDVIEPLPDDQCKSALSSLLGTTLQGIITHGYPGCSAVADLINGMALWMNSLTISSRANNISECVRIVDVVQVSMDRQFRIISTTSAKDSSSVNRALYISMGLLTIKRNAL